jgi:pilus assembly protein Flp/PilA
MRSHLPAILTGKGDRRRQVRRPPSPTTAKKDFRMAWPKSHLTRLTRTFASDTKGAVAIEYGILVLMIAVALLGMSSLTNVSNSQSTIYNHISNSLSKN